MDVLSNLSFKQSSQILDNLSDFPPTPADGQMSLIGGVVYIYTTLKGMKTWYPLTNEKNFFVHSQATASTEWTVTHDLQTSDFVFFTYDENQKLIQGSYEYINENQFKIIFTAARKGRLVLFFAVDGLGTALSLKSDTTHTHTAAQVGLGNVDNTADLNKPVSTATQAILDLKANKSTTYTKTEVDNIIGNIQAALDLINGVSIWVQ